MMPRCMLVAASLMAVGHLLTKWASIQRFPFRSNLEIKCSTSEAHEAFPYPISRPHSKLRTSSLPPPLQVMEEYIQKHSVDALARDPNLQDRKFAIAFYQCPLQAGNRLHHFWNGVLWSILTNRTVLWQYWSEEACMQYGKEFNLEICKAANTVHDCDKVLTRAPWMASYDEWKDKLLLANKEPFVVPYHATMGLVRDKKERFPLPANYEESFGVDVESKYPQKVLVFPVVHFKYWQLTDTSLQKTLLLTDAARDWVSKLYSYGADFLFGMLHRYTFDFSSDVRASLPAPQNSSQLYTIGLHSRHRYVGLDGCNIERETACLDKILNGRKNKTAPVQVAIMSDRPCTVKRLLSWLEDRNCSVLTATHVEESPDYIQEHGPYAGVGFFEDLAVVSTSRSAIIGMRRTSSDLLRELIVFQRVMEAWDRGDDPRGATVDSCILSNEVDPARIDKQ